MDGFKEFTGKSLDDAISEACSFFDTTRERLELDIVQDAKSGIFGLVGARKAMVRARRVQLRSAMEDILGRNKKAEKTSASEAEQQKKPSAEKAKGGSTAKEDGKKSKASKATSAQEKTETDVTGNGAKASGATAGKKSKAQEAKLTQETEAGNTGAASGNAKASKANVRDADYVAPSSAKASDAAQAIDGQSATQQAPADIVSAEDAHERTATSGRETTPSQARHGGRGSRQETGRTGKKTISSEQEKGRKERLARKQAKVAKDTTHQGYHDTQGQYAQYGQHHDGEDVFARPDDVDGNRVEGAAWSSRSSHAERPRRADRTDRADRADRGEGSHNQRKQEHRSDFRKPHGKHMHSPVPHAHVGEDASQPFDDADETENVRRIPLSELDQERLSQVTLEVVGVLTRSIVGEVPMSMKLHEGRIQVHLDCEENSGLLIGREGQTLAALQYIISRIVSREMDAVVRVQLDAGDYRTRQDEKLSDLALILAERVRSTGKPHSTRPLSSYHRRIVHVALQNEGDLITRSSGDGPLKRVIIQRKRV